LLRLGFVQQSTYSVGRVFIPPVGTSVIAYMPVHNYNNIG
jgi:hypothetical protein